MYSLYTISFTSHFIVQLSMSPDCLYPVRCFCFGKQKTNNKKMSQRWTYFNGTSLVWGKSIYILTYDWCTSVQNHYMQYNKPKKQQKKTKIEKPRNLSVVKTSLSHHHSPIFSGCWAMRRKLRCVLCRCMYVYIYMVVE